MSLQTTTERVRRTKYSAIYFDDVPFLDLSLLLRGSAELSSFPRILGLSVLKGQACVITFEQLQILSGIPAARWVPVSEIARRSKKRAALIHDLVNKGLVLTDRANRRFAELRKRDEQFSSAEWNIHAALYHTMTKWQNMHLKINLPDTLEGLQEVNAGTDEAFTQFVGLFGKPPTHFYDLAHAATVRELPVIKKDSEFYRLLLARKTTRAFDKQKGMKIEDLTVILYYVWGCHGVSPIWEDIVGLKKTSPSGGDLHPVEVYPLVSNVEGIQPGLYQYSTRNHALELVSRLTQAGASDLANEFTAGQQFPRSASVLFIMTARFYRNFWKYRQHQKSYTVIFMDAAHLSQTFYLVCAELGLGAFITAAINSVNIERKLGLDGITEGAIAVCGCGKPLKDLSLDPEFLPYIPRQTAI
jgi:putative peptide maturation dehydrogenase